MDLRRTSVEMFRKVSPARQIADCSSDRTSGGKGSREKENLRASRSNNDGGSLRKRYVSPERPVDESGSFIHLQQKSKSYYTQSGEAKAIGDSAGKMSRSSGKYSPKQNLTGGFSQQQREESMNLDEIEEKKRVYKQKLKDSLKAIAEKELETTNEGGNTSHLGSKLEEAFDSTQKLHRIESQIKYLESQTMLSKERISKDSRHDGSTQDQMLIIENSAEAQSKDFYYEADSDEFMDPKRKLNFTDSKDANSKPLAKELPNPRKVVLRKKSRPIISRNQPQNLDQSPFQKVTGEAGSGLSQKGSRASGISRGGSKRINKKEVVIGYTQIATDKHYGHKIKNDPEMRKSIDMIRQEIDRDLLCKRCNDREKTFWDKKKDGLFNIEQDLDMKGLDKIEKSRSRNRSNWQNLNRKSPISQKPYNQGPEFPQTRKSGPKSDFKIMSGQQNISPMGQRVTNQNLDNVEYKYAYMQPHKSNKNLKEAAPLVSGNYWNHEAAEKNAKSVDKRRNKSVAN
jgi:hypothetical protein